MKTSLPIDAFLPRAVELLSKNLVVSAAPGAGKTTRLPPALLPRVKGAVWVLEPRRIAAISAAQRIAEENGWELGREVGYQVRFEKKSSAQTRILFLTEALLLRKLIQDPELRDVGCVVLDEFHERSVHVDLALGALRELQELARPDLKVVVMSATLDAAPLAKYLGDAPVVDVPGKLFPLTVRYGDKPQLLRTGPEFTERMARLTQKTVTENPEGDALVFLPGRGEIERLREALEPWAASARVAIHVLHGQLDIAEQRAAIMPDRGRRKVILTTNVAESSLTVEGVRIVIDSGLARISQLHPRTGFESLDLVRISKASATQRAGRAARLGPGLVVRAWIPHDELSMRDFELPELTRSDLSESLLLLSSLGVTHFESFSWFEAPPPRVLHQAREFLIALGALSADGTLSPDGRRLRELPVHPRIAKLLLVGEKLQVPRMAAELAALLSEKSSRRLGANTGAENDLLLRWQERNRSRAISRAAEQLQRLLGEGEDIPGASQKIPELALAAWPDRLCRRRRPGAPEAKMVGGRGVKLHPDSSVHHSEFFVAVEVSEGRTAQEALVFDAVGISEELLAAQIIPKTTSSIRLEWDEEKQRFFAIETRDWLGLSVGKEHRRPATALEIEEKLVDVAEDRLDRILAQNTGLAEWWARVRFLAKHGFSEIGPSQIREALAQACYGEKSLSAVAEKNLVPFFEASLETAHREALHRQCPSAWTVPSGSRLKIQYSEEQGPMVEVRLQELFGLPEAPKIAGAPLTLVLLAPNFRPVQVTRDLASFWRNGYPEVRKEMRTRYPKHAWPEDPLSAAPQAKGRPRSTAGEGGSEL